MQIGTCVGSGLVGDEFIPIVPDPSRDITFERAKRICDLVDTGWSQPSRCGWIIVL